MWSLFTGFYSGIFFVFSSAELPSLTVWLAILMVLAAFPVLAKLFLCSSVPCLSDWFSKLFPYWLFLVSLTIGAAYAQWRTVADFREFLPATLNGRTCSAVGVITGLPELNEQRTRFTFQIEQLDCPGAGLWNEQNPWQGLARLSWHSLEESADDPAPAQQLTLEPGQHWQLCVRLKRPHGFASAGATDYEAQMLRQGIGATGYVYQPRSTHHSCHNTLLADLENRHSIDYWRHRLSHWLDVHLEEGAGLVRGLLVGDSRGLLSEQWQLFRQTGTVHLLVISGLHISLIALFCWWLMRVLGWLGCLPLARVALPRIAVFIGLLGAWSYGIMAGFGVPVQRALVMLSVGGGSLLLGFRLPLSLIYLLALTAVLLVNPWVVTSSGFWLSFLAVAGLLYLFSHRHGGGRIRRWLTAQWLMTCLLAPVLANLHQTVTLWSPLVNLVSVPLVGGLLVPLLFVGLLLSGIWQTGGLAVLQVGAKALALWEATLNWLVDGSSERVLFELPATGYPALVLALLAMVVLFLPKAFRWRWLGIALLMPWLWPVSHRPADGTVEITVLDVGQGLAVLAQTRHHTLLYDTGDRFTSGFSAAQAVIVPFLQHKGIRSPDRIVISHADRDHIGGLELLQTRYPEAVIDTPDGHTNYCPEGQSWIWDDVRFTFLGTGTDNLESCEQGRRNDCSCVLRICAGFIADRQQVNSNSVDGGHESARQASRSSQQECALLTGDISWRREQELLVNYEKQLSSRLLLAPHHGSQSSSSAAFLAAVRPQWLSCSAGYANRFGHPAPKAWQRMSAVGTVLVTAQTGSQTFVLGLDRERGLDIERELEIAHTQETKRSPDMKQSSDMKQGPLLFREHAPWWRRSSEPLGL